jgi:predicted dehydrogenase
MNPAARSLSLSRWPQTKNRSDANASGQPAVSEASGKTRSRGAKAALQTAGAGLALPAFLSAGLYAAGDDTLKLALVGCGSRGTGAASQALATKGPVKLWAMADLFADRLETSLDNLTKGQAADYDREGYQGLKTKIEVPPERRFAGFDAYRQAIDSGVDVVILATPPHFRPAHYEYAVQQGKHVFVEKPVAVDAPGVRRILSANEIAKQKNLKVGVGLMLRHSPPIQQTIARIREGAIGTIPLICCYWNMGHIRDTVPRPASMTEMAYQLRNPYHFLWLNGDYLVDALMHYIDMGLWAKGTHPIRAQGQGGRQIVVDTQRGDIYDHHVIEYAFADGATMYAQTRQMPGCWNHSATQVYGTSGTADIGRGQITGVKPWRFRGNNGNAYQIEHDVLFDAIRRDQPHNEIGYVAQSTMTSIMGRMASYSGQSIRWEDALQSNQRLGPEKYSLEAPAPVNADANGVYPVAVPGVAKVM